MSGDVPQPLGYGPTLVTPKVTKDAPVASVDNADSFSAHSVETKNRLLTELIKSVTKRKRPVPPEARDPAHSLKCDPNIRADQVFIPLNLAEVEACLDRDLWISAIKAEASKIRSTFKVMASHTRWS